LELGFYQEPLSDEELDYVNKLDVARDAAHLRSLGIREECVTTCTLRMNERLQLLSEMLTFLCFWDFFGAGVICTNLLKMCTKVRLQLGTATALACELLETGVGALQENMTLHDVVSIIRRPYEYYADGTQKSSILEGWISDSLDECAAYKTHLEVNLAYDVVFRVQWEVLF